MTTILKDLMPTANNENKITSPLLWNSDVTATSTQGIFYSIGAHIGIFGYHLCAIEILLFDAQVFQLWEGQPRQHGNVHGRSR